MDDSVKHTNEHTKYCDNENLWVLRQPKIGKRATAWCPKCGTLFFRNAKGVSVYPPNSIRKELGLGEYEGLIMKDVELKA